MRKIKDCITTLKELYLAGVTAIDAAALIVVIWVLYLVIKIKDGEDN